MCICILYEDMSLLQAGTPTPAAAAQATQQQVIQPAQQQIATASQGAAMLLPNGQVCHFRCFYAPMTRFEIHVTSCAKGVKKI